MKNSEPRWLVTVIMWSLLAGCTAPSPNSGGPPSPQIAGNWSRTDPAEGRLQILPDGTAWRVRILAAGKPDGWATAADCEGEAVGSLDGDTLVASAVPFASDNYEIDQSDIDRVRPGPLTIKFSEAGADVSDEGLANFCGVGSELGGLYVKVPAPLAPS